MVLLLCAITALLPRSTRAQSADAEVAAHFHAGQDALRQADFTQAAEEFKKVLALDPTLVEAQVNLGLAYQSLSDYELAVRYLVKALQSRPNLLAPNVIVGMDYVKLGSPGKGLPYLQRALKLDSSNPEAHAALASCYLQQGNFRGAAEQFRALASSTPDQSEALFRLGHEYLDLAARLAYRGARLYPDSAWGHRFLGDLLFERNRWDESAKEYRKGLASDPQQAGLHTSLAEADLQAGHLDEAATELRIELQLHPMYELARLRTAELAIRQRRPETALENIAEIWKAAPEFLALQKDFPGGEIDRDLAKATVLDLQGAADSPAKHFLLATLLAATGEDTAAEAQAKEFQNELAACKRSHAEKVTASACHLSHYSACVQWLEQQKPQTISQRLALGRTKFALQQYDSAAEVLAAVPAAASEGAEASYWLSRTYQALGVQAYSQLQESFPDSWRTHQLRGESAALRKDYDVAAREFQAALEMRPQSAELHEALGELYLDTHANEQAESELQKAIALGGARARALYLLGRLYVQNQESEKAIPYLQKAARLEPDFSEANTLLGTAFVRLGRFSEAIPSLESAAPFDHYGNVHYQLYVAYKKVGKNDLAARALAKSQDLRRSSLEHDEAAIMGSAPADE